MLSFKNDIFSFNAVITNYCRTLCLLGVAIILRLAALLVQSPCCVTLCGQVLQTKWRHFAFSLRIPVIQTYLLRRLSCLAALKISCLSKLRHTKCIAANRLRKSCISIQFHDLSCICCLCLHFAAEGQFLIRLHLLTANNYLCLKCLLYSHALCLSNLRCCIYLCLYFYRWETNLGLAAWFCLTLLCLRGCWRNSIHTASLHVLTASFHNAPYHTACSWKVSWKRDLQ